MDEEDIKNFDQAFNNLKVLMTNIIRKVPDKGTNKKNPILTLLEEYATFYAKTDKSQHVNYFRKIYDNNKTDILKSYTKDFWLKDGKIVIKYGEEYNIKTRGIIHLSTIYCIALKLREQADKDINDGNISNTDDLTLPEEFMLYLYQIFSTVASIKELDKINEHINEIKRHIGYDESNIQPSQGTNSSGSIMDMIGNLAGKDFSSTVGQFMNNESTQNILGNITNTFKNSNGITDIVNSLVSQLGNPQLSETVNQYINQLPPNITDSVNQIVGGLTQNIPQMNDINKNSQSNINPEDQE